MRKILDQTTFADEYPDVADDEQVVLSPGSRPIVVFFTEETYMGTEDQAILLKWHYHSGHFNTLYLRTIAKHVPGMEELLKIPHRVKMPQCD
eukprot:1147674-Rhodomonas_salina.1